MQLLPFEVASHIAGYWMAGGPLSFRVIMWLWPKEAVTSWHSQFQLQMPTGHFLHVPEHGGQRGHYQVQTRFKGYLLILDLL